MVVGSAITGTIVSQNVIERESVAIVISNPAGAIVNLHLNDLESRHVGVDNLGAGIGERASRTGGAARVGPARRDVRRSSDPVCTFAPWLREPIHDDNDHR